MRTDAWGLDDGYFDVDGTWHASDDGVIAELHRAMGADEHPTGPPEGPPIWFVRHGDAAPLRGPAALVLEDGAGIRAEAQLPADLPTGYHDLHPLDGGPMTRLVVTPGRCTSPPGTRTWGWAVQAHALHSRGSWGHGDLADVAALGHLTTAQGGGLLALSPLHAPAPVAPLQTSPYFPSSRQWRNPLFIRIEDVPGFRSLRGDEALLRDACAVAGRSLDSTPLIERDRVWALKRTVLAMLWQLPRNRTDGAFETWRAAQGTALASFALHEALAEEHRCTWPTWPARYRNPESAAVAEFAATHRDEIAFHSWLQWLLDGQLATARSARDLVIDLAVGAAPDGADAWRWQHLYAPGVRVGAPPDAFNAAGQDWGLPPWVPWRLRAAHYEPFIQVLRSAFVHAAGLRVDHVMGLFRLYWIPQGSGPTRGAYVRGRADEMLDLLALEATRAGAFVVGEDLGTVEGGVREELAVRGLLSTRLAWFEEEPPSRYPTQCLAALTTHDLPTVAGLLDGTDDADRRAAGVAVHPDQDRLLRRRLDAVVAEGRGSDAPLPAGTPAPQVAAAALAALAAGPAHIVAATLEDALGVSHRPNLPGTVDEHPNWRQRLPVAVEDLADDPGVAASVAALRAGGARSGT